MSSAEAPVDPEVLEALDRALVQAYETGDESALSILGYGEISCVLAGEGRAGPFAAKPLPPFPDHDAVARYRDVFEPYLRGLEARGIHPVPSALHVLERPDGLPVVWCVQKRLDAAGLLPTFMRERPGEALPLFRRILDAVLKGVGPRFGLDGQLSNWALSEGELFYLDVTTPMMRSDEGAELLDTELFIASLPAALRPAVRRFALRDILDKYYDPRGVVLDLLGNMLKERLEPLLAPFLAEANPRLPAPITEDEARRYYASDARLWGLLQRMRRMDRAWQRHVRRRPYPFLLPGPIER